MRAAASLALIGFLAALIGLAAFRGGDQGGRGPTPVSLRPAAAGLLPPAPPPAAEALRRPVPAPPAVPEEGFEALFARAVACFPPARLTVGICARIPATALEADPAWKAARALLERAAAAPEAPLRSLEILAGGLAILERHLPGPHAADQERLREAIGRLQDPLARIQAATWLVQRELEVRADREPRPRSRISPVTEHAGRVLELLPLSATAAGLVQLLLAERGIEPGARRFYLRGCHRAFLEGLLEPCDQAPWVAGAAGRLLERLLENMLALGEATAAELAALGGSAAAADLGVPWESPEAGAALAGAWERAGREAGPRAYQLRRTLTAAFLSRTPAPAAAIHAADRFYGAYPRFFALTPDAWPNLAWKPGALPAIMDWIRSACADPERAQGVLDALAGLNLGGGLVDRAERGAVERFFLELWEHRGLPAPLRGYALVLLGAARTVPADRTRTVLEEALVEWGSAGAAEQRALAEAVLAFLARAPGPCEPFLEARFQALAREGCLDPALRQALERALAERGAGRPGGALSPK